MRPRQVVRCDRLGDLGDFVETEAGFAGVLFEHEEPAGAGGIETPSRLLCQLEAEERHVGIRWPRNIGANRVTGSRSPSGAAGAA